MLPFRVQCETCQSWLKVARESLVGQIHSCPKCGSMVHLVPGAEEALANPGGAASAVGAAAAAPISRQAAPSDFESVDELGLNPAEAARQPKAASAAPSQPRVSPLEALGNKAAIAIGAGGAALVVFGAVAFWLTSGNGQPAPSELAALTEPTGSPTPAPSEEPPPDEKPAAPAAVKADVESPTDESPTDRQAETDSAYAAELPPLPPEAKPPVAREPAQQVVAQKRARGEDPADDPPAPAVASRRPEIDPLDFDPAKLDLVMLRGDRQPAKETPAAPPEPRLAIGWDERDAPPSGREDVDQLEQQLDGRLAERAQIERVWVERGTTAFEDQRPVDLARRLNDKLPELTLPDAPLGYGVRLWSELAGVAVTLDPQALTRAGVSPRTRISLSGADATLAELLREGLEPLRLTYAERDGQLTIARLGGHSAKAGAYSVADLADSTQALDALRDLAAAMVPTIDDAALRVDRQKFKLVAPANAHFDLMVFCERLRRARGLPQRTKYPASLLATDSPLAKLESPLSRTATFSFVSPTPLADVFAYWRGASGLELLVDWGSVAHAQLGPQSLVRCSSREQPWREALDGVLHPLGLGWRVVDERTLQIASRADAALGYETTEFYPLAKHADGAQTAEELTAELAASKGSAAVHFDEPSQTLIVRTCDANHRAAYDWLLRNGLTDN